MTVTLPSAEVLLDLLSSGKGIGIGKTAEFENLLDVEWDIRGRRNLTVDGSLSVQGKSLLDLTYPVGSIYISVTATNPSSLFGGAWERIAGRFLLGYNSNWGLGTTGGESSHKLTATEMPSHTHTLRLSNGATSVVAGSSSATVSSGSSFWTPSGSIYSVSMDSAGGSGSHNNMPPYLAVAIWKRTA